MLVSRESKRTCATVSKPALAFCCSSLRRIKKTNKVSSVPPTRIPIQGSVRCDGPINLINPSRPRHSVSHLVERRPQMPLGFKLRSNPIERLHGADHQIAIRLQGPFYPSE